MQHNDQARIEAMRNRIQQEEEIRAALLLREEGQEALLNRVEITEEGENENG